MRRIRRNAFALSKKGDISPEPEPSPDYSEGVFGIVPSSDEVVLQHEEDDDESRSSSCPHITEEQVQGKKITLVTSTRPNVYLDFLNAMPSGHAKLYFSYCCAHGNKFRTKGILREVAMYSVYSPLLIAPLLYFCFVTVLLRTSLAVFDHIIFSYNVPFNLD